MDDYIFDYRLGYVRKGCDIQGFDIIGEKDSDNLIVTLGGYTTPELAQKERSWTHALYSQTGGSVRFLNGCTDGYASAQILTVFIRDVILFKPKLVICLSGFHDIAYKLGLVQDVSAAGILKSHQFATPLQIDFYKKITEGWGLGNNEVFYGIENHLSACENWLGNMELIKCLCDEFGLVFKSLLQPCIFSERYKRSKQETAFLCSTYEMSVDKIELFREGFQKEYAELSSRVKGLDYVYDRSFIFDGCKDVYLDAYHVKDKFLSKLSEGIL